jgi:hypothetical protein
VLTTRRVQIELDPGADPIRGSITGPSGVPRCFDGWSELAAEIEEIRAQREEPRDPGDSAG